MFAHIGFEVLLVSLAFLLALIYPRLGAAWFDRAEAGLAEIARKRTLSIAICGLSALVARVAVLPWLPIPRPSINDEFSFLLASDTFAHGRLTNPVHPMWIHFETFHQIFHPTYASMYPPLQGMALALGQLIFGHPFWGVWLSVGLMCAAICWMMQAWVPPQWALLGGLIPVFRFGVFSYWDNSYWGGALAATGGALMLGAMPRIIKGQRVRDSILLAIGAAVLANTRPYEGFVLAAAVAGILGFSFIRKEPSLRVLLGQVALPIFLVLAIAGAATSYYCWRVTGNALKLPQQENRETYAVARYFYGQTAYPVPAYHHEAFRDFYVKLEAAEFHNANTVGGMLLQTAKKIGMSWIFYFSPILTLPLFMLGRVLRDRRLRLLMMAGAAGFIGSVAVIFFNIHYLAPIVPVILAVIVQCLRQLRCWHVEGRSTGLFLQRATILASILMIPMQVRILATSPAPDTQEWLGFARATVNSQLTSLPGPQLVLVRYGENHDPQHEWVYNGADIDHQKVVWARDMGSEQNQELLRYFADRRIWLLEPEIAPLVLKPYSDVKTGTQILAGACPTSEQMGEGKRCK
jgi:hypothetical protein